MLDIKLILQTLKVLLGKKGGVPGQCRYKTRVCQGEVVGTVLTHLTFGGTFLTF